MKRFIYKFFPILLFIFLLANCRDSSDIVVSEQHFTDAKVSLDLNLWKEISPDKDTDSVRSPGFYSNFYPHLFKTTDGELVLRSSGIWAEPRGWIILILVILFYLLLKTVINEIEDPNPYKIGYWLQVLLAIGLLSIPFLLITIPLLELMNPIREVRISSDTNRVSWNRVYYGGGDFPANYISYVKEGKEEVQIVTIANEYITLLRSNDDYHRQSYSEALASTLNLPRIHPKPTSTEWKDWLRISLDRGAEWNFDGDISNITELSLKQFRERGKSWRVILPTWESKTNSLSLGRWFLKIAFFGIVVLLALMFFGMALTIGLLLGGIYGGVILFLKTLFRVRKYPEDSREEFLEICLKSKLFWTFCILWILNAIALGYSFAENLKNQLAYDSSLKEFGQTEIISKFHKSSPLVQALSARSSETDNSKIRLEDLDWKEYMFNVFFRSPWEQYAKLQDLTRINWELSGNHIPRNSYDLIECNHEDTFYMDEPIRCDFFIQGSPDNRRVNQFNMIETDPFHGEIVARILDGRRD